MKRLLLTGVALLVLSAGAQAGQCPALLQKGDAALASAELSDADKAKIVEMRNKGESQHAAGQHAESVATLNEALQALGQ